MRFANVQDPNAMEARHEYDELKDAPTLRSIPKVAPFVVPDGFFEQFPHALQARIVQRRSPWARFNQWIGDLSIPLRIAGATAVVAVIASAFFFALSSVPKVDEPLVAEITIAPTDLDIADVDEAELLAMMDDDAALLGDASASFSADEMAAYLENEELPLDLLIEEL